MPNFKICAGVLVVACQVGLGAGGCGLFDPSSVDQGGGEPPSPPARLVTLGTAPRPFWLAVDATAVYAASQGDQGTPVPLVSVPINGGATTRLAASAQWKAVAVDDTRLYWSDGASLFQCDKQDCAATTTTLAPFGAFDIEVNATTVYWSMTEAGRIMKIDKAGGTPVVVTETGWPYGLALDADNIYWIDQVQPNAGILKMPLAGGAAVQLAVTDPTSPGAIALDASNVYFLTGEGKLFKVAKTGGPVRLLNADALEMQPLGLATDGVNVYAGSLLHGSVIKIPVNGGSATTIASGMKWPNCLVLDANYVYIADEDANAILKIAK